MCGHVDQKEPLDSQQCETTHRQVDRKHGQKSEGLATSIKLPARNVVVVHSERVGVRAG